MMWLKREHLMLIGTGKSSGRTIFRQSSRLSQNRSTLLSVHISSINGQFRIRNFGNLQSQINSSVETNQIILKVFCLFLLFDLFKICVLQI